AMKTKRKKTDAHRNVPGWKTGYLGFRIIVQVSFTHLFIDGATSSDGTGFMTTQENPHPPTGENSSGRASVNMDSRIPVEQTKRR
ncbi:MAG: hypothetical protein O7D30_05895, partial [Rickettsia endosymbiont of Ixodes persulcatus]|nr:hypothetical protein [Rickettsia endosymbiont of Ixodes persulcatus]